VPPSSAPGSTRAAAAALQQRQQLAMNESAGAEESGSPHGMPGGLGDVLHRMSAEDFQFEQRGDARLLGHDRRQGTQAGPYPEPPQ
jgi:hypothetical protein